MDDTNELLVRIDERTRNIWKSIERIEKHQEATNGRISDTLEATAKNTSWRKISITLWAAIITVVITNLCGLW